MLQRLRPGPRTIQRLRHWGSELLVVAIGVLLALWAQAWFEARRDAGTHRETLAQIDDMLRLALVVAAARVSADACARERISALDDALRSSNGQWTAMPAHGLPEAMRRSRFPQVYLADAEVLPLSLFDIARENGALAALPADVRARYQQVERQLTWLTEAWAEAEAPTGRLALLGVDGPLGEGARDELRQALVAVDRENHIVMLRARSLARLAREHGASLTAGDRAAYQAKLERDRGVFGDCMVEVDPLTMEPATATGR